MKKILIATAIAVTFSGTAFADMTDTNTMSVSGTMRQTLSVSDAAITVPDLVRPDASHNGTTDTLPDDATSVELTCGSDPAAAGTVAYTGQGNPFAGGNTASTAVVTSVNSAQWNATGTCGTATVTGEASGGYIFTVDATVATTTDPGVALDSVLCVPGSTAAAAAAATGPGVIAAGGTDTLNCGAKVSAVAAANPGAYAFAGVLLTVTYD